ncbi:hypothetical protein [Massilia sp. erpn]|uniref:hypothetical protein n=1 Tax=Massilia sp. erpn TaxID=2738142 RepID=UPI002103884B|nr:hypothetical protein [Massilia sp. erpn]UTY55708.1 hypothetical protein HPQ68_00020 [Massilia sp. erpn]
MKLAFTCFISLLLAACGGSGGGPAAPQSLSATAGTPVPPSPASPVAPAPTVPVTPSTSVPPNPAGPSTLPSGVVESDYYPLVTQLHLSYFGGAADYYGFTYFSKRYLIDGMPLSGKELEAALPGNERVAEAVSVFAKSPISGAFYSGTEEAQLEKMFRTLFNRAPDSTEKAKWRTRLETGQLDRNHLPLALMNSAAGADLQVLGKKLALSGAYSLALSIPPQPMESWQYDASRSLLAAVDQAADETLFAPLAQAAARRFESEAYAPPAPPPPGSSHGFSSYKFLPAAVLMCATKAGKSSVADYLVAGKAVPIREAAGLAAQRFAVLREDCPLTSSGRSFSFDAAGNATLTTPAASVQFAAAQVSQALKGEAMVDTVFKRSVKLQAYSVATADGGKAYVLIEKSLANGTAEETLAAWTQ